MRADRAQAKLPIDSVLERKTNRAERSHGMVMLSIRLAVTVLVVGLLLGVVGGLSVVRGSSMEPALHEGDVVLLYRLGKPQRGDIVILRRGGAREHLVKRVLAVGGDEVRIDDEGGVLINGVHEPGGALLDATFAIEGGVSFPYRVPSGSVFLLGDNRAASKDSRELGAFQQGEIAGKVILVIGRR